MPSREEVLETARLARLALTTGEIDRMQQELGDILNHVDAIREVAASAAGDVEHGAEHAVPLRPDVPGADPLSMPPSYFAPEWHDGFFTVPRLSTHD